jgi:hypothetical protein
MSRVAVFVLAAVVSGCGARFEVLAPPPLGYDVVIVPGCPSEEGGALSGCQISRAVWAAELWQRRVARHFITSGGSVHSPYVEAEALAEAMTALGVPPERIYLERDALHTDENMYFSLQIARAVGFRTIAVASVKGHARWGCKLLEGWGQACGALSLDFDLVKSRAGDIGPRVCGLRSALDSHFRPLVERERERARASGRRRPPSFLLYPFLDLLKVRGEPWVPYAPERPAIVTWAARIRSVAQLH